MKPYLILLLFIHISAPAQPFIKKVIIEGEGRPMLMLNGGTADMSVFAAYSRELSGKFKVIRMEQFNVQYAKEDLMLPGNYSIRMESEAIKLTFDSLGIKEPVVLVGHSFGGLIALDFAITHPDYIHSLVLIEPPVFGIALARNESPAGMKKMQDLIKDFTPHADITEQMVKDFRCSLMNCDEFDIHEHPLWHEWVKQKNRLRGLSVINDYQIDMNALHKFSKPVLIITGTQTVQFHQRIDELLTGEFSNVKTGSLDGGHTAVNANPTGFIELLLNFLK